MARISQHMPRYYVNSKVVADTTTPIDLENTNFLDKIQEMIDQFIVSTATTTLNRYEEQYGLEVNPQGITTEERRSRIKAKMRSVGAVNAEMIQNVVSAWTNADVEIIEDFANYKITIKFVNVIGIPTKIDDVYKAIDEIIPAHIKVEYEFKYVRWVELENKKWIDLEPYTWQEVLEGGAI